MEVLYNPMKIKPLNKKGQGVVSGLIAGVGFLIVLVIITLVIVVTMIDADLFEDLRASTPRQNQSLNTSKIVSFGNDTLWDAICTLDEVKNMSDGGIMNAGNYTVNEDDCTIVFSGNALDNGTLWSINSTTSYDGEVERSPVGMAGNLSTGINKVSAKLPTILLIAAVVILLAVLGLLMKRMGVMNIGGGSNL